MKALALLLVLCAAPSRAIMPTPQAKEDAKRFSAYHQRRRRDDAQGARGDRAVFQFNSRRGGMRPSATGQAFSRGARPGDLAAQVLSEGRASLGIDPSTLVLDKEVGAAGHKHALYRQTYRGLPVEFASVKVHLADNGAPLGIDSNYEQGLRLDPNPSVLAPQAAAAILAAGANPGVEPGVLVVLPDPSGGAARLAWRFNATTSGGKWRYYVDAKNGSILFRFQLTRNICGTSGTMSAMIYDIDPLTSLQQVRPLAHMTVYQGDQFTSANTQPDGTYCGAGVGKIFTQFQGPFVNVSYFRGPSAHYDNGSGVWTTVATPLSSPHPYPKNSVIVSTIDLRGIVPPGAVKFLPVFSNFDMGSVSRDAATEGGDITIDDQLTILDSSYNAVASYVGQLGAFNGAAVAGQTMYLRLKSSAFGSASGYDVSRSSYLTLNNPYAPSATGNSVVWVASYTYANQRSEFNLFYHLNMMHDFFMHGQGTNGASLYGNDGLGNPIRGVDASSAAYIGKPLNALALVGPNIANPFYDPDYDDIIFGDISDTGMQDYLTDDASVPHHEYTHYVVEKIFSLQNFGEAGAISEGLADYFSGSSLNTSDIAIYTVQSLGGGHVPLRELDSAGPQDSCGPTPAVLQTTPVNSWVGEIHCDGRFLGQSLWDIRKSRVALQGLAPGRACADGLAFQALLFFPESFSEFENAMLKVDSLGLVPACAVNACGGNPVNCAQTDISGAFTAHGLQSVGGTNDPYDTVSRRNDGFETAVDIATITSLGGTIYPAGDIDFYTFPAGAGPVSISLSLPADALNQGLYKGYALTLYDTNHKLLTQSIPNLDGINTISGFCDNTDCTTSQSSVSLVYSNPSASQFFLEISGAPTFDGASNSGVNSTTQYRLTVAYQPVGAISGGIVKAAFDNDKISFQVHVTTWPRVQDYSFAYAQLRDQAGMIIPATLTHVPAVAGDWITMLSSTSALGLVSGTLQVQKGFSARFPAVGTVRLEVFGYNVVGSTITLGQSQPFNLTTNQTALTAYNNVFNPDQGQKTTIKYEVQTAGHVSLRLYTVNGTFITTLLDTDVAPGKGTVDWGGVNVNGRVVSSGVYILLMQGPGISKTQKIVVVK